MKNKGFLKGLAILKKIKNAEKFFRILTLTNLFSLFFLNAPAFADDHAQLKMTHYLKTMQTYSAHFTQSTYDKQNQVTAQSQGLMAWEKPDLFFWQIQSDPKQSVILKKNVLYVYDPDLSQLSIRRWKPVSDQVAPVLLLNANANIIAHHFEVKFSDKGEGLESFNLMAKDKSALFYLIQLIFKNGQLIQMNLHDALSGMTQIRFNQIKINQKINPELFSLHYPPSTEILDERKKN